MFSNRLNIPSQMDYLYTSCTFVIKNIHEDKTARKRAFMKCSVSYHKCLITKRTISTFILLPHCNLSMVDCISKTRMLLFADKRVSVEGHLVFSCQFYVGLWCKDYDQNKNNCGHEHCTNIVPKCYCGNKELVISSTLIRPMVHYTIQGSIQTKQTLLFGRGETISFS